MLKSHVILPSNSSVTVLMFTRWKSICKLSHWRRRCIHQDLHDALKIIQLPATFLLQQRHKMLQPKSRQQVINLNFAIFMFHVIYLIIFRPPAVNTEGRHLFQIHLFIKHSGLLHSLLLQFLHSSTALSIPMCATFIIMDHFYLGYVI